MQEIVCIHELTWNKVNLCWWIKIILQNYVYYITFYLFLVVVVIVVKKTNSALRYISNAHTKKIYSLDWCASEEILLSSSRDRNIKVQNKYSTKSSFIFSDTLNPRIN